MKKIFALCATVALFSGAAIVSTASVAHAQASGAFADVPTDHWAYNDVDTLQKAGIVIGYPDNTYGGKRAMTRYEFATAIARILPLIKPAPDLSGYATKDDLNNVQTTLQSDLDTKLQQNQQALDALKALVTEFQTELEQLGQDVTAIKARLDALEQRVAVVEAEQRRVKINGDVNFIGRSNVESSGTGLVDQDGYYIGNGGSGTSTEKSIFGSPNFYEDVLLSITGQVSDTATAVVKIDAGNYIPTLGNYEGYSASSDRNGTYAANVFDGANGATTNQSETFDLYRAYLDAPVSLGPLGGAELKVGRFGEQFTDFTLKAIQPDSYASTPETASGDVTEDGLGISTTAGPVSLQGFAAKNDDDSNALLQAGANATSRSAGFLPGVSSPVVGLIDQNQGGIETATGAYIDQSAGLRATVGTPDTFTAGVTGLIARIQDNGSPANAPGGSLIDPNKFTPYNNLLVYGADYNGLIPGFGKTGLTFDGSFTVSSTGEGAELSNVNSHNGDEAWKAELGYDFGALTVKGGYEDVYANFGAPGYWGHIGSWTNPTNVKGGIVNIGYTITPKIKVVADGNFFQGQNNVATQNPLGSGDNLDSFDVGIKSALSSAYSLDLGYEYVYWNLKNGQDLAANGGALNINGKPTQQYITIGIGHPINKNSDVKLLYQIIDYKQDGTDFSSGDPTNTGSQIGGVALTQLAVHF